MKDAVDSLAAIPEVIDLVSGNPGIRGNHLMDESFGVGAIMTFASKEGLAALLKSEIHNKADPIFKVVCSRAQGYTINF